jgi:hypothetical protein
MAKQKKSSEKHSSGAENREAARQGNPASSSYSRANREGTEHARRAAADRPGSEYHGEAGAMREGGLTNEPQRGAAGSR